MPRKRNPLTGELMIEGVTAVVSDRTGAVTFRARCTYTDGAGKRHYPADTFKTYEAAEEWYLETQLRIRRGMFQPDSPLTVADYHAEWSKRMARQWAESTTRHNEVYWRRHFEPEVGAMRMSRVRRADLQRLVDRLADKRVGKGNKPLKAGTIRVMMAVISGMFAAALVDGVIQTNPALNLSFPANERPAKAIWSALQVRRFLSGTAGTPEYPLWVFMASTGCRIGEAIAMRVTDFDWDDGTVRIHRTGRRVTGGGMTYGEGTKTKARGRAIRLEPWAIGILREHMAGKRANDFAFTTRTGRPYSDNEARRRFMEAGERLSLPRITPHGLRHSVATILIANGVPESIVKDILGHSSIRITVDTYTHVSTGMQRVGTEQLGRLLGFEPDTTTSIAANAD